MEVALFVSDAELYMWVEDLTEPLSKSHGSNRIGSGGLGFGRRIKIRMATKWRKYEFRMGKVIYHR